jgi:hypothetical protein
VAIHGGAGLSIGAVVSFGEPDTFKIDQTVACKDFGARGEKGENNGRRTRSKNFTGTSEKDFPLRVINVTPSW